VYRFELKRKELFSFYRPPLQVEMHLQNISTFFRDEKLEREIRRTRISLDSEPV
jgi:hypothetical protein